MLKITQGNKKVVLSSQIRNSALIYGLLIPHPFLELIPPFTIIKKEVNYKK
ncbi:hypothetical protein LCGC14_1105090 [marine sediment metagenome]|uniref:Uncharacterized protein n=1 Tax=marine sediment metagenome TaxID=412755 RepID=A0A0F9MD30_9ZZZZ